MLVLFHDYTSPASAVATLRLQRLADGGLPVHFTGYDVMGLDISVPAPAGLAAEVDQQREPAAALGLTLVAPSRLPSTIRAHAVGVLADRDGLGASWRATAYRGFWEDTRDLGSPDVLVDLARTAGLDPDAVRATLEDRQTLAALRRRMHAHRGEGVGGVPIIQAGGTFVPAHLPDDDLRALAEL